MTLFLKIGLTVLAIVLLVTGILNELSVINLNDEFGGGRRSVGKFVFKLAPAFMYPLLCLAAANNLDERPFVSRSLLIKALLFLAVVFPVERLIGNYDYLQSLFSVEYNHMTQVQSIGRLVGFVAWSLALPFLALYFVQKLKAYDSTDNRSIG